MLDCAACTSGPVLSHMGELRSVVQVLTPEDLNMPFQEVQFFAADGVSLTGWYLHHSSIPFLTTDRLCIGILYCFGCRPKGPSWSRYIPQSHHGKPSRRTIVCCHPYNSSKSNLLGVARGFWDQRYALFLFDFRSFAHIRTEQSIGFLEQRDARAAIATAKQLSPEDTRIGVMGASMGGAVSLIVGHEEETAAVGILSDCAFSSLSAVLEQAIHHRFPYFPSILTQAICQLSAVMNPAVCWFRGITPCPLRRMIFLNNDPFCIWILYCVARRDCFLEQCSVLYLNSVLCCTPINTPSSPEQVRIR